MTGQMHNSAHKDWQQAFLHRHGLPLSYMDYAQQWFMPILEYCRSHHNGASGPLLLAISGCQGSGKSAMADYLGSALREDLGLKVLGLSLDDFYLGREQRLQLARQVHPLLQTRGVPGTHETQRLAEVVRAIDHTSAYPLRLPRFDKAIDDRLPEAQWMVVEQRPSVVILEGWCIGARPQSAQELDLAINSLEAEEDPDGRWREYINTALQDFLPIYERIDRLIMLKAPDFSCVFDWRREQEQQLARQRPGSKALMDETEIQRFIAHYQRLTEQCLAMLPARADYLLEMDRNRQVIASHWKAPGAGV